MDIAGAQLPRTYARSSDWTRLAVGARTQIIHTTSSNCRYVVKRVIELPGSWLQTILMPAQATVAIIR